MGSIDFQPLPTTALASLKYGCLKEILHHVTILKFMSYFFDSANYIRKRYLTFYTVYENLKVFTKISCSKKVIIPAKEHDYMDEQFKNDTVFRLCNL